MTHEDIVYDRRVRVIEHAAKIGNVSEACRVFGVSRKTYYQWEKRALQGMMEQLEEQPPGRPATQSDPQLEAMKQKIAELETKLTVAQQTAEVRAILLAMEESQQKRDLKKKKNKSPKC